MLHNLPTKEVPKELIISSKSIRLLDAVGQGILSYVSKLFVVAYNGSVVSPNYYYKIVQ